MIGKIAWKNIVHKPLNTALCVCLLLFGVGIISLLLVLQDNMENKFLRDLKDIDVVAGAKGSPLQLVLSAVYHLDAPTGNIKLAEARKLMQNPLVKEAIPLAYGDSYRGHRILGTTEAYAKKYDAELTEGRMYESNMEATIGADVAKKTGLKIGDVFHGTHGDAHGGHVHDDHPYTVVGILSKTNTVIDHLLLCTVPSVWQVHTHEDVSHLHIDTLHATELHFDPDHHHHHEHEHDHDHDHDHDHGAHIITADSMEITAILLKYKMKRSILTMPRLINSQTNMQAVLPALEINRLFYMIGIGATTLKMIAAGIMVMAAFSVFFVLYNRLRERRHELALMRTVGYRPRQLFTLLLFEGLLLAIVGFVLGWLLSRVGLYFVNQQAEGEFNMQFSSAWVDDEYWLLLVTILVGIGAALIPAWRAMRMDVSDTLAD